MAPARRRLPSRLLFFLRDPLFVRFLTCFGGLAFTLAAALELLDAFGQFFHTHR